MFYLWQYFNLIYIVSSVPSNIKGTNVSCVKHVLNTSLNVSSKLFSFNTAVSHQRHNGLTCMYNEVK